MAAAAQTRREAEPGGDVDLATLLDKLAGEIAQSAAACSALQWSISTLLEKVHHPDLAAEIHMLQDIDRLQQTLTDSANVLSVCVHAAGDREIDGDTVAEAVRLASLRARLGLARETADLDAGPASGFFDDDDVTWF